MNFCQKHRNHHCLHAHNCTNPDHKTKQDKKNLNKTNKSQRALRATTIGTTNMKILSQIDQQLNEQCDFQTNLNIIETNGQYTMLQNKLRVMSNENGNLKIQISKLNRNIHALSEQNRQQEGVLEYYRAEMDRIVKCNAEDYKEQVKKHLKDSKELNSKNKFLISKLALAQKQIHQLETALMQITNKMNNQLKEKEKICTNYDSLFQKFRKLSTDEQKKGCDLNSEKKKNSSLQSRYQIIMEETNKKLDQNSRQIRNITAQNRSYQSQIQILTKKLENSQQLNKIDKKNTQERQKLLKKKLQQLQDQITMLKQKNQNLQTENKLKRQQIDHCKRVIDKQIRSAKSNGQLLQQIDKKTVTFGANKENQNGGNEERQGEDKESEYIRKLQNEIIILKDKLRNQQPGSSAIQEYILTIGASEAFKRIIEEKNIYIKQLIREKGSLLSRVG